MDDAWWDQLDGALSRELQQHGFDPDAYLLRFDRDVRQVTLRTSHHHPKPQLNFQIGDEFERRSPEELAEKMVEMATEKPGQQASESQGEAK